MATAVPALDVAATIEQYSDLIHKESNRAAQKMPPRTVYTHDDLYQEGAFVLAQAIPKFNPDRRGYRGRRPSLTTFLAVCLQHRYGRLVGWEWDRATISYSMEPSREDQSVLEPSEPAEQQSLVEAQEVIDARLKDRYWRLRAQRVARRRSKSKGVGHRG